MLPYIVLPLVILLNISYLYYWLVVIYARTHKHIDNTPVSNADLIKAYAGAVNRGEPYMIRVLITTKGGSLKVVKRGIDYLLRSAALYPKLQDLVVVEVITEEQSEVDYINKRYSNRKLPVEAFCLPAGYETPNGTQLKARALHYMVEQHRNAPLDSFIVHYDEESVMTPGNFARMVRNLLNDQPGISEGTISYPLEWFEAHPICRTMESNRPFGCHECYVVMTHPAPLHLHGSNLVIKESLENQIGWDIGKFKDNPLIAEDLVFGLMVYIKYGRSVFGWHGGEMYEQPPFTLKAARKQRERWVMGALQGINHVTTLPGWDQISWWQRFKITGLVRGRIFLYAVGLPITIISLTSWFILLVSNAFLYAITGETNLHFTWFMLPGLLMWLGGTQLGLAQNIKYATKSNRKKLKEHLMVLLLTPFAGLHDTFGPMMAVLKWASGKRGIKWNPTPKLIGQEIEG